MSMIPITTHVQEAIKRLLQQYKEKPRIEFVVSSLTEEVQNIENMLFDLLNNRSINTAIGIQLDRLGTILGIEREGLSDEDYRARLKIKVVQNVSSGEPDRLISVYAFLINATQVQFQEHYPAGCALMGRGVIPSGQETLLYTEIQRITPAGVRVDYIGTYDANESFAMTDSIDSTADGFGDLTDALAGGKFGGQSIPSDIKFAFDGDRPDYYGFGDLRDPYCGGMFE